MNTLSRQRVHSTLNNKLFKSVTVLLALACISPLTATTAELKSSDTKATASADSAEASTFAQLGWLAGVWHASFRGGQAEDVYQPVNNGEILSTFKLVVDGKVTRYELRSIRGKNGRLVFNELAYGPELAPLDPLADRPLLSSDATHINFDGLVFTRTGENSMHVDLTVHMADGKTSEFKIDYTRVLTFAKPEAES